MSGGRSSFSKALVRDAVDRTTVGPPAPFSWSAGAARRACSRATLDSDPDLGQARLRAALARGPGRRVSTSHFYSSAGTAAAVGSADPCPADSDDPRWLARLSARPIESTEVSR